MSNLSIGLMFGGGAYLMILADLFTTKTWQGAFIYNLFPRLLGVAIITAAFWNVFNRVA